MKIPTRMGADTSTTVSPSVAAATRSSRRHSGLGRGQIGLSVSTSWKREDALLHLRVLGQATSSVGAKTSSRALHSAPVPSRHLFQGAVHYALYAHTGHADGLFGFPAGQGTLRNRPCYGPHGQPILPDAADPVLG